MSKRENSDLNSIRGLLLDALKRGSNDHKVVFSIGRPNEIVMTLEDGSRFGLLLAQLGPPAKT